MKRAVLALGLIVAVGLAVPVFAGDIVAMPTANMQPAHTAELNYIYWQADTVPPMTSPYGKSLFLGGPNHANIEEVFVGVTDWLEVDGLHFDIPGGDNFTEANVYVRLIPETAKHPSLVVGATNITGSNWVGGSDDVSPFIVGAYNINVPAGCPTFNDPLVRLQMAWGDKFHDGFFGGVQAMFTPRFGAAVFNYQGAPSYLGVYTVNKMLELRAGWKSGSPFYSAGLDFGF